MNFNMSRDYPVSRTKYKIQFDDLFVSQIKIIYSFRVLSSAVRWQSIGTVQPDSHRICHWTAAGNFHQFLVLKIGVFQSGFRWVSSWSPPENVGECKDLQISITFDAWTLKSYDPYLAVTAHYIVAAPSSQTFDWELKSWLLGFQEIQGNHGGANLAATILQVLDQYGIQDKVRFSSTSFEFVMIFTLP